ncbi:MAG: phosphate signaling complex protein PhoU [Eubacteriales bacterium]
MSPRIRFDQELTELHKDVEEMSHIVECEYDKLFEALKVKDRVALERIEKNDRNVNDMQHKIEAQCLNLITRQQPIARDLRMVSAALKVVTDIERIGDNIADMAELFIRLDMIEVTEYSIHIQGMVEVTKELLHKAVNVFVNRDMQEAEQVIKDDDVVDALFNKTKEDIIQHLKLEKGDEDACIDILMVAKYLERIADHATNIAEWEIFQETGTVDNVMLL